MKNHWHQRISFFFCVLSAILPTLLLYSMLYDKWHTLVLVLALLLFSLCKKNKTPFTTVRALLGMLLIFSIDYLFSILGGDSSVTQPRNATAAVILLTPALSILAAVLLFFRPENKNLSPACLCIVFSTVILSGAPAGPPPYEDHSFTALLFENFQILYTGSVILTAIGCLFLLSCIPALYCRECDKTRKMFLLRLLMIALALLMIIPATVVYQTFKRDIDRFGAKVMMKLRKGRHSRNNRLYDPFEGNLNYAGRFRGYEDTLIAFVDSDKCPGYLRQHAYADYRRGVWNNRVYTSTDMPILTSADNDLATSFFAIPGPELPSDSSMTIYPVEKNLFRCLPLPVNTVSVEMIAEQSAVTYDGAVFPKDWNAGAGYTVHTCTSAENHSINHPDFTEENNYLTFRYLHVPQNLKQSFRFVARSLILNGGSDRENIAKIVTFLKKNYTYELNAVNRSRNDPTSHFLFVSKKGHCELFASAATLLLRSAGIPARYACGYLCNTPFGKKKNTWLITGRDGHAWTEVYLRDEKKWISVDPTPEGPEPLAPANRSFRQNMDDLANFYICKFNALLNRGVLSNMTTEIINKIETFLKDTFTHPAGILGLLILSAAAVWIITVRVQHNSPYRNLTRNKRNAIRRMKKIIRKTEMKTGTYLSQGMTLRQWESLLPESARTEIKNEIREYERIRFRE